MYVSESFAVNLKRFMHERRISGRDLSVATGISETSISRYRQARIVPDGNTALTIAKALNVPEAAMWADSEQQASLIVAMANPDVLYILYELCFHGLLGDQE